MNSLTLTLTLVLLAFLTSLATPADIIVFSDANCQGSARMTFNNVTNNICCSPPKTSINPGEGVSALFLNMPPKSVVIAYYGDKKSPCAAQTMRTWAELATGGVICLPPWAYNAFLWEPASLWTPPLLGRRQPSDVTCNGEHGPDQIVLSDGTEYNLERMMGEDVDELWDLARAGLTVQGVPTKFSIFRRD